MAYGIHLQQPCLRPSRDMPRCLRKGRDCRRSVAGRPPPCRRQPQPTRILGRGASSHTGRGGARREGVADPVFHRNLHRPAPWRLLYLALGLRRPCAGRHPGHPAEDQEALQRTPGDDPHPPDAAQPAFGVPSSNSAGRLAAIEVCRPESGEMVHELQLEDPARAVGCFQGRGDRHVHHDPRPPQVNSGRNVSLPEAYVRVLFRERRRPAARGFVDCRAHFDGDDAALLP